jgi:hypothetical protein
MVLACSVQSRASVVSVLGWDCKENYTACFRQRRYLVEEGKEVFGFEEGRTVEATLDKVAYNVVGSIAALHWAAWIPMEVFAEVDMEEDILQE